MENEQTEPASKAGTSKTSVALDAPKNGSFSTEIDREPVEVNLHTLLEAGAHFGHQARRWNPKMLPYIYGVRNGVHILNLDITLERWARAEKMIEDLGNRGGSLLLVGTKPQARDVVRAAAARSGAHCVTQRWLGGTLSNFQTIKRSIARMRKMEDLIEQSLNPDSKVKINKKERLSISRDLEKLQNNLGGIRDMKGTPQAIFVVDVNKESIAVAEARNLHIPVFGLVDTNVDPSLVDYPIPSNDDAHRTIRLFVDAVADAFARGRESYQSRSPKNASGQGKTEGGVSKSKDKDKESPEAAERSPESASIAAP